MLKNNTKLRHELWNYNQDWFYFITICTRDKQDFFWEIVQWKMILNWLWKILKKCWNEIPIHFKNIQIDEFVVMPNHFHWILIIDNFSINDRDTTNDIVISTNDRDISTINDRDILPVDDNCILPVDDRHACHLLLNEKKQYQKIPIVIWSFKSACTKNINRKFWLDCFKFSWQKSFYDRIIRDEKELFNIRKYIKENPAKWDLDENNMKNKNNFQ